MKTGRKIVLRKNGDRRILRGHDWVFSNEIGHVVGDGMPEAGETVRVFNSKDRFLAVGYANPNSLIAVRILDRVDRPIDDEIFTERIEAALAIRAGGWGPEEACRLIHGEADGLPGLIVDRYGPHLVLQVLTAGMNRFLDSIVAILGARVPHVSMLLRGDSAMREREGLPKEVRWLEGEVVGAVKVIVDGLPMKVDLLGGQKTGMYLDQGPNRKALAKACAGKRVLDAFCHTGAWALHALAGGAASVTLLDSSESALDLARENVALAGGEERCEFLQRDAFEAMRRLRKDEQLFDVVCLDPPSFAHARKDEVAAYQAYQRLDSLGINLLAPGGRLVTSCCSHNTSEDRFIEALGRAACKCKRRLRILSLTGAGPDHPIHPAMPETRYLKCIVAEVE